jgi:ELWxxDGT repeat protein
MSIKQRPAIAFALTFALAAAFLSLPAQMSLARPLTGPSPLSIHLVKDIDTQPAAWSPSQFTQLDSKHILFVGDASNGVNASTLWETDGTTAGTHVFAPEGQVFTNVSILTRFQNDVVFLTPDAFSGTDFWKTDGTASGTKLIADLPHDSWFGSEFGYTVTAKLLFFMSGGQVGGQTLWRTDGTPAGTFSLGSANPSTSQQYLDPSALQTAIGNELYFVKTTPAKGTELWKTDGTPAGTVMVKDIDPGPGSSSPTFLTPDGSELYFDASDGTHGDQLWKSDGTAAGTTMVADISTPGHGANIHAMAAAGSELFFSARPCSTVCPAGQAPGPDLWESDGTAAGTHLVAQPSEAAQGIYDITPLPQGSSTSGMVGPTTRGDHKVGARSTQDSLVLFDAIDGKGRISLWRSDGTASGTFELPIDANQNANPDGFVPIQFDGRWEMLFDAYDPVHGTALWQTDGTVTGTTMIEGAALGRKGSNAAGQASVSLNGRTVVLFSASNGIAGSELWETDGASAGTAMIPVKRDITNGSCPDQLLPYPHGLFFTASSNQRVPYCSQFALFSPDANQLYQTDGTSVGTHLLVQAQSWPCRGTFCPPDKRVKGWVQPLLWNQGYLYYQLPQQDGTSQLWRTAGWPHRAQKLATFSTSSGGARDVMPYSHNIVFAAGSRLLELNGKSGRIRTLGTFAGGISALGDVQPFVVFHHRLCFAASTGRKKPWHLWSTGGTRSGTSPLLALNLSNTDGITPEPVVSDNRLYFLNGAGKAAAALWITDGTNHGTRLLHQFPLIQSQFAIDIGSLTAMKGWVYLAGSGAQHGYELWRTHGTPGSTQMVKDIAPGATSGFPFGLTVFDGRLWFRATDGLHGDELWVSDGTAAGTILVKDFNPAEDQHVWGVGGLTPVGDRLFFTADEPGHKGLWMTDGTVSGTQSLPGSPTNVSDLTASEGKLFFVATTSEYGEEPWVAS